MKNQLTLLLFEFRLSFNEKCRGKKSSPPVELPQRPFHHGNSWGERFSPNVFCVDNVIFSVVMSPASFAKRKITRKASNDDKKILLLLSSRIQKLFLINEAQNFPRILLFCSILPCCEICFYSCRMLFALKFSGKCNVGFLKLRKSTLLNV